MSTTYHPQTDGQTERVNQSLEQYLRCYVDYNLDDWSRLLSTAEFAYSNQVHEGTKETPFYLEYGRHPRAGPTLIKTVNKTDLSDIMKRRMEAQESAKAALNLAAERMKYYYDKGVQNVPFKVGDKVLLNLKDYQRTERALQPRYEGPFEIIEQLSPVTFKLKLPARFRAYHPVFHASKLATYKEPTIPGQKPPTPSPVIIRGQEEWEVEKILQHKKRGRGLQYLVRWKGMGREEDTWEPAVHLKNAPEIVKAYHESLTAATTSLDLLNEECETLQVEVIDGQLPTRGSDEAAGLDLYASQDYKVESHTRKLIPTGIKVKLPIGTYGRIAPRSGLSVKGFDIGAGVIDRDYTGEIRVLLVNNSDFDCIGQKGERIAQLVIEKIATVDIIQVDNIEATARGEKGFGSTGV